jgi:trigger factor
MKVELEEKSPTRRELKIEIPAETVKEVFGRIAVKYRNSVTIQGFRKGNAPIEQVKLRYKEEIGNEVIREVVGGNVQKAIDEQGIVALAEPEIHFDDYENLKTDGSTPIKVHVHVEVMCEVPMPNYKGLEAARRVRPVPAEDADKVIEDLRKRGAALLPVEGRKSDSGDTVMVDLVGTFEGDDSKDPITAEGVEITIGDEQIEKSFTENLVGLGEDETKEFSVSYAEDFGSADLAGRTVTYKATVKSIGRIELPELTDEWAQSLEGDYESLKDLREKISKDMETMAKADADARVRNDLVNKLIEENKFEVPRTFVQNQAYNLLNRWAQDLAQRGMDVKNIDQQFMQMILQQQMMPQAELDVVGSMLLEKIGEVEGIEIGEEELNEEILRIANYYRVPTEDVRNSLAADGGMENIRSQVKTRKTIEVMVDHAVIKDEPWVDETEPTPVDAPQRGKKASSEEDDAPAAGAEPVEGGADKKPARGKSGKKD